MRQSHQDVAQSRHAVPLVRATQEPLRSAAAPHRHRICSRQILGTAHGNNSADRSLAVQAIGGRRNTGSLGLTVLAQLSCGPIVSRQNPCDPKCGRIFRKPTTGQP